jgi:hypothetical protein
VVPGAPQLHATCTWGFCGDYKQCSDGMRDGDETGADCGGALCPPCGSGPDRHCLVDMDCLGWDDPTFRGQACFEGYCTDRCHDNRIDGGESDVDCGGSCANACQVGQHCNSPQDCFYYHLCTGENDGLECPNGICISPCSDGVQNGDETDVDCGGGKAHCMVDGACPPCSDGLKCKVGTDCKSGVCEAGICGSESDGGSAPDGGLPD